ncbi:unnamed protein product [Cladocopium goreaui]|uniref:Ribosome biogenesis protein NOP53 n=1 Tax=Cladocopium goreaui TaxID=2562237 RepID=A0A9P1DIL0_9DINO|nr:unnamed protein product [Cladocopium goreaui]
MLLYHCGIIMYIMCQSRRQEMKEAMQDVVRAKLESVRVELEGEEASHAMDTSSGKRNKVMKTIEKIKRKKQSAKQAKVDRKLLRAAKEQGAIKSIKVVREILEGKKKTAFRPDGAERRRDKRVRVAREKRERLGFSKVDGAGEEYEDEEQEEDE